MSKNHFLGPQHNTTFLILAGFYHYDLPMRSKLNGLLHEMITRPQREAHFRETRKPNLNYFDVFCNDHTSPETITFCPHEPNVDVIIVKPS